MVESNKIIEDLKELGPLELRSVASVMWNIKWYRELYNDIIHEIVDM